MNTAYNNYLNGPHSSPSFEDFLKHSKSILDSLLKGDTKNLDKWRNVIGSIYDNMDNKSIIYISTYLEMISSYYYYMEKNFHVASGARDICIKELIENIREKNNKRSAVVRKIFNYRIGRLEYELEDGNFVTLSEGIESTPEINIDIDVFPTEFVRHIDLNEYRNMKIDKIL